MALAAIHFLSDMYRGITSFERFVGKDSSVSMFKMSKLKPKSLNIFALLGDLLQRIRGNNKLNMLKAYVRFP